LFVIISSGNPALALKVIFWLRGLCKSEDRVDYILLRETLGSDEPTMRGLSGLTNIVFNATAQRWDLRSLQEIHGVSGIVLGYTAGANLFPVGVQGSML
jgi:hypothetical protein